MSPFKAFTDFLGGICAFVASFFLVREFLSFAPAEGLPVGERLKLFFDVQTLPNYRVYAVLALLFVLAVAVGRLLRRFPAVVFPFSLLPFLYALSLYRAGLLPQRPMLYLLLGALLAVGAIADVMIADGRDGKRRRAIVSNLSALLCAGLCLLVLWRAKAAPQAEVLSHFDAAFQASTTPFVLEPWIRIAVLLVLSSVAGFCFFGAYWIELILTLPPAVLAWVWYADGTLAPHGEILLALLTVTLLCRLGFTLTGGYQKDGIS